MVCAQCGAVSEEGQRFCYNCGARLAEYQSQAPTIQATQPLPVPPPPAPLQPVDQQQGPGQYNQGYGYSQPQVVPNSGLAIGSLVAGILAWAVLPVVSAIVAVVLGHLGRNEIRQSGGRLTGDGLAVLGLILGYVQLALAFLGACFVLFFIVLAAS